MKRPFLILYAVIACFFITVPAFAQKTCEAKCLSGDCANGSGTYRFDDCTIYEGSFKSSALDGKGRYTYATGETYDGNWTGSKRNGYGKHTWSDGTRYEGYFVNDVMDGQGTIYYANGEKYVGQCYKSKREGKGIHYNANGTVYYDGYWKDNTQATQGSGTTSKPETTPPPASEDEYNWLDAWLDSIYPTDEVIEEDPYDDGDDEVIVYGETTQGKSSGNFCTDYKTVAAQTPTYFESIKGTMRSEEGDMFKTTTHNTTTNLAGSTNCYIQSIFGTTYYADFGVYSSQADAETKFNELKAKIKSCLTDKIFEDLKPDGQILKTFSIVTKYADGFDSYGNDLRLIKNDEGKYEVMLLISSNIFNNRIYTITSTGGSGDAGFDSNVKKVFESARTDFKPVLGDKHETDGFWGKTVTYDVNASIPGIFDLSYSEGGITLSGNELKGVSYEGTDQAEAKKAYNNLSEKLKKGLGSSYIYRKYEATEGETMETIFGLKSERRDEKTPIVEVEYNYSKYDSKYTVRLVFAYKGFNSLL